MVDEKNVLDILNRLTAEDELQLDYNHYLVTHQVHEYIRYHCGRNGKLCYEVLNIYERWIMDTLNSQINRVESTSPLNSKHCKYTRLYDNVQCDHVNKKMIQSFAEKGVTDPESLFNDIQCIIKHSRHILSIENVKTRKPLDIRLQQQRQPMNVKSNGKRTLDVNHQNVNGPTLYECNIIGPHNVVIKKQIRPEVIAAARRKLTSFSILTKDDIERFLPRLVAKLTIIYETINDRGQHWGLSFKFGEFLNIGYNIRNIAFSSPFNYQLHNIIYPTGGFCSLFAFIDFWFGSFGQQFWDVDMLKHAGDWFINPPFTEDVLERTVLKFTNVFDILATSEQKLTIHMLAPDWSDATFTRILLSPKMSPYLQMFHLMKRFTYKFSSPDGNEFTSPVNARYIIISNAVKMSTADETRLLKALHN